MFGVGLHFSLKDLLSVKASPFPARRADRRRHRCWAGGWPGLGWPLAAASCSASRSRSPDRGAAARAAGTRLLETERGRIAVGWLIVEDLVMVLALVLLPAIARPVRGTAAGAGRWCRHLAEIAMPGC
jgi:CPA2 family monovalent cation:H+ antiporter-2